MNLFELDVKAAALAWLAKLGFSSLYGPGLAAGMLESERKEPNFRDVILECRLQRALERLNPDVPSEALDEALRKIWRAEAGTLLERNRAVHRVLVDAVPVEYRRTDGAIAGAQVRVTEFDESENNDWVAVNHFTVVEERHERRSGILLCVNGLSRGRKRSEKSRVSDIGGLDDYRGDRSLTRFVARWRSSLHRLARESDESSARDSSIRKGAKGPTRRHAAREVGGALSGYRT